jgi:K+-sensing histidine kinase KdpD
MDINELEIWSSFNDKLITVLAHDLRQPFASIIMTAEMLKLTQKPLEADDFNMIIEDLRDTAAKSIELLDGLLYWVKSKKEGFEYKTQPLLLNDLLNESNGLYVYDQQKKDISFFNLVPERQLVFAHKQMLQFINRNILSNATKHSPNNGIISVTSKADDNWVTVAFNDQGRGMTREQLHAIFNIQEIAKPDNTKVKCAGMALSICYDMIRQMNGSLWAESSAEEGTTFYYALPVEKKHM